MEITNGINHWRTESSAFDANAHQGSRETPQRRPKQRPKQDANADNGANERTLPAIKPGAITSGGALRREVPPAAGGEVFATDDGITPLPALRRRTEAYERMLNIF